MTKLTKEQSNELDKINKAYNNFIKYPNVKDTIAKINKEFDENISLSDDISVKITYNPVFVIDSVDTILDFINESDESIKSELLNALDFESSAIADKALFITSLNNNSKELIYIILLNINTIKEHKGLILVHSTSLHSLSYFISEFLNISEETVKTQFKNDSRTS